MGESAYDHLVGEFSWLGFKPKYALKLAGLFHPSEELIYDANHAFFDHYIEGTMDLWPHKYDEFDEDEPPVYKRVFVYIDGANLLRSFAFIKERKQINEDYSESYISISLKNYQQPIITDNYPIWYIFWILVPIFEIEKSKIEKVTFVMCADNAEHEILLRKIESDFGFEVVIPEKKGIGLRSSSNEDKFLKDLIISDLQKGNFDIALIGTGDGNKKDGISFPEIAKSIEQSGKKVMFAGFDITTSKKIKENFEFIDIVNFTSFPRGDDPHIFGVDL